jgi:deazaflavin-dependent oxidoreductase (nitroreductase family)
VLELVTTGHKSGAQRSVLLTFIDDVSGPAVIGTNAGFDVDPAWVKNLRKNSQARIRVNGRWSNVVAREITGVEHERIWSAATRAYPGYNDYLKTLTRSVPIFQLVQVLS